MTNTLQEQLLADVLQHCYRVPKVLLKNVQFSLENTCVGYNVNVKVWLLHSALTEILKKAHTHSCFPVSSAGVLRRSLF